MKGLLYMLGFLLIGVLMPVAIWVAAAAALFHRRTPPKRVEEPVFQV